MQMTLNLWILLTGWKSSPESQNTAVYRCNSRMDGIETLETKSYKNRIYVFCTSRCLHHVDDFVFNLPDSPVSTSTSVRNICALFYQALSLINHVYRLLWSCYYQIRLMSTTNSSHNSTREQLHHITNWLLQHHPGGSTLYQMDHVQSILNVTARLIYGRRHFDHVSDLICDTLQWLRVPQQISFRCALLAYKVQNGLAPN